jgi:hypothetical protein
LEIIRSCTLWDKILIVSPKENGEEATTYGEKYPLRYGNSNSVAHILLTENVFKAVTVTVPFFRRNVLLGRNLVPVKELGHLADYWGFREKGYLIFYLLSLLV